MIRKILSTCFVLALTATTWAAPVIADDFSFTGLLTANGWAAHSGAGTQAVDTVAGLTYTGHPYSGVGNAANLDNTGEDVNKAFTAVSSGPVYVGFLLNAQAATEGYFLMLSKNPIDTTFRGKVFITTDGTGDYELGLTMGSNTISNKTSLNLAFNTTYFVVLRYDIVAGTANDSVSLHVLSSGFPGTEPASPAIGPISDAAQSDIDPGSVALRQYNAAQRIIVDSVRVSTTWAETVPVNVSAFSID
ncbi:hypothetical protein CVU37_15005 [candidate division BRC1 bacterium HGW-BRC1-1]|jgi:hypothetical protein|nr:MAG: hypothetical protein CVU37_15005 [candidate division BRC1 bacterium HGW-BRC1-1]